MKCRHTRKGRTMRTENERAIRNIQKCKNKQIQKETTRSHQRNMLRKENYSRLANTREMKINQRRKQTRKGNKQQISCNKSSGYSTCANNNCYARNISLQSSHVLLKEFYPYFVSAMFIVVINYGYYCIKVHW